MNRLPKVLETIALIMAVLAVIWAIMEALSKGM